VIVKLAPKRDGWIGDLGWNRTHYVNGHLVRAVIYINDALPWETTQSTLWHEWAHVLRSHMPCGDLEGDAAEKCSILGAIEHQIQTSWRLDRGQE
jgi:hypothetical protein